MLPGVRVVGVVRTPTDLTENPDAPPDVTFTGTGAIYATAAFYHRFAASVASRSGLLFHLKRGAAGLGAFEAEVKRVAGSHAQIQRGDDATVAAASARRGTSLQAFAFLLFGVIVALAMVVIVAQSIARRVYTASGDFPVLRALGTSGLAAFRGRAGSGRAGRGGRDGAGGPGRLGVLGVYADRAGAPGGDLPRILVQRRDLARRGSRPCAAACRLGSDYGAAGGNDPCRAARGGDCGPAVHGQRGGWPAQGSRWQRCRACAWRSSRAATARLSLSARPSPEWRWRWPR